MYLSTSTKHLVMYKYIFEAQVQSTSKYSKKCTYVHASTSTDVLGPNPVHSNHVMASHMTKRHKASNINRI